jgi:hypothetical protein
MKKTTLILSIITISALVACSNSGKTDESNNSSESAKVSEMTEVNLSGKGIPVTLSVPAGSEVADGMGAFEMDGIKTLNYEIKKGQFLLSVSMTEEDIYEEASYYYEQAMSIAKESEGFAGVIKEEPNGFIYKITREDGDDYNFYYLLIKEKRAIEFEAGLSMFADFTQADVEKMYNSAKSAK